MVDGILVPEQDFYLTPFRYKEGHKSILPVDFIVIHYSGAPYSNKYESTRGSNRERHVRWLSGTGRRSSTHFSTLRDGVTLQACPLTERAWHSGKSKYQRKLITYNKINFRSIGIDLDNVGQLFLRKGKFYDWYGYQNYKKKGTLGRPYQGPSPYQDEKGQYWEPYTVPNFKAVLRILFLLSREYPLFQKEAWRVVGHEEIKKGKTDPGAAFPWGIAWAACTPGFSLEMIEEIDYSVLPGLIE
jgi:N-acetyl-anhydromuramyl-L-alanine amidase AmpD